MLAAFGAFISIACQKEYEIFDELAITSHTLNIAQTPGETHIVVYSTGAWSVAFDKSVNWASLNKLSGEGLADFVLSWSANYGTSRSVNIIITRGNLTERIAVIQEGNVTNPYILFDREKVVLPRQAASLPVSMTTNLSFNVDDFKAKAVYYDGESKTDTLEIGAVSDIAWINGCTISEDKIEFTVKENASQADRKALLICYNTDASGIETRASLSVVQTASNPVFTLSQSSGDYYSNGESYLIPSLENNIWSLQGVQVSADADWLQNMSVVEEGLSFTAAENLTGTERSATVKVSYISPEGLSAEADYVVKQAYEKLLSYSELRAMIPGTVRGKYLIEGIIVSDPESPNLCSSPQTGQYAFDRSENERTAYIESLDASYGFCLKFNDISSRSFRRGAKVLLHLDGVSLVRETNPLRFTLANLTSESFTVLEETSDIPVKARSIAQLTDADIHTYVSITDVEILCKDGCYTNASEGYCMKDELNPLGADLPRWDVAPLLFSDINGNAFHMLTNAAAPWRRTGQDVQWYSALPQGSGTISGIIVSDVVAPVRYGNLGKYQIRPISEDDIKLDDIPFSNIICEWNWNDGVEKLTPDIGKGTFRKYDAATKFTYDYNNPYLPTENTPNGYDLNVNRKGLVVGGAICLTQKWWDFTTNEGKYIDVEFSTAGLSGNNLVFGIVWGHGTGSDSPVLDAPSHWKVLYSTDGANFNPVPSVDLLKQRSCAWWDKPKTSQDATPGYTEHLVKLPASCLGRSKVIVRLQVADTVTDIAPSTSASTWRQALGIERGTLTPNSEGPVRIGTITVRFN